MSFVENINLVANTIENSIIQGTDNFLKLIETEVITGASGGTGVSNKDKTITLGGNLTTSGTFNTTIKVTRETNVTLPNSGTLAVIESPSFEGKPTAPTAPYGTNTNQLATTAFANIALGVANISTTEELVTLDTSIYTVAIVRGLNNGGTFVWSLNGTVDNGIVFTGDNGFWNRQYRGAIQTSWFNSLSDAFNSLQDNGSINIDKDYNIASSITINKNDCTINGLGSVITKTPSDSFDAIIVTGSGNIIDSIKINGNNIGWSGITVKGSYNTIQNCRSYNNGGHGILLDGTSTVCQYNTVTQCRAYENGQVGIAQNTALNSRITENIAQNNKLEGITVDLPSYKSIIDGNVLTGNCVTGGVGGIGVDQAYGSVISNNTISSTNLLPAITFQCNVGDTVFCTINGNTFLDNGDGGIHLKKTGSFYSGFNVISGNIFLNNNGKTIIIDSGCNNNTIGDNIYNGIFPIDNGANNKKSAGSIFFKLANNTVRTDVTGDGTWYTVPFDVEVFDSTNTCTGGIFTVPMKGIYEFDASIRTTGGTSSNTWGSLEIASTGTVTSAIFGVENTGGDSVFVMQGSIKISLNAGDTVQCNVRVGGGTKVCDITASINECFFIGNLIG